MSLLDWIIIILYLAGMIALGIYVGRQQENDEDYYVGGRKLSWWALGISIMATQSSAISFISKPAFVALRPGGGLNWLQYELALPLAMIVIMVFLIPFFRRLKLVSVYEYLELRYNASVRYLVSGVFLLSRGLAAGMVVYTTAMVLEVCLDLPLWSTILIIGVVTLVYDTIGGITAVVYTDVIQMAILFAGIIICIFYSAEIAGGFGNIFAVFPQERLATIDYSTGLGDESPTPFWGLLIGGFFLYVSYYGTDQSQVQRGLSADSVESAKRSLFLSALARFPFTALYLLMGISIYAVYQTSPELRAAIPANNYDYLVPQFVKQHLPAGIRGIIFAAILAATMSTLDSVLNSLSAATKRDFIDRVIQPQGFQLLLGKAVTVTWGIAITGFAFFVGKIDATVVESINKLGSAFYGPILAAFLAGIISKRVTAPGIFSGIIAGVGCNVCLWLLLPGVSWMWWNVSGLVMAMAAAWIVSLLKPVSQAFSFDHLTFSRDIFQQEEQRWLPKYAVLAGYFFLILMVLIGLNQI
jgi:SSS family solute:Na+ symporter